jgi:hypothetical protein
VVIAYGGYRLHNGYFAVNTSGRGACAACSGIIAKAR